MKANPTPRTRANSPAMTDLAMIDEEISKGMPEGTRKHSITNPGDINKQMADVLIKRIPMEEAADAIQSMIRAKRKTRYGEEVDQRAKEAGLKLYYSYVVGLPVQRQEIKTSGSAMTDGDVMMRILESPALFASMEKMMNAIRTKKAAQEAESVPE